MYDPAGRTGAVATLDRSSVGVTVGAMYLNQHWWPPGEPAPQPRKRAVSDREERTILALVVVVMLLLVAPIGGATILQAIVLAMG